MYKSHKSLPPLSQLPAFEASARLLSFTRAASELHLSQAAVSQQIRQLEDNLGIKLFKRMPRQIKLTEQGQKFQHTVAVALELLENSASELRSQNQDSGLTIAADISMAYMWLLPHFPQFREAFPEIDVSVFASERESECLKEDIELALLYGTGNWQGFISHLLIHEEVYPVCSPDYFTENAPLFFDVRLSNHTLLDLKAERWDWIDWHQLLSKNRIVLDQKTRIYDFNSLPLLTEATLKGQGIGLGWKSLTDRYIESGELIRPFNVTLKTGRGYYVLRRADSKLSEQARLLFDWIVNSAKTF